MALPLPYPDAELVMMAILDPIESASDIVTWIPENAPNGLVVVTRTGGVPDQWDVTDYPLLRVSCYGQTRAEAWDLQRECQRHILAAAHHAVDVPEEGGEVLVDSSAIADGSSQVPELDPDDRRVDATYVLGLRRQYHLASA